MSSLPVRRLLIETSLTWTAVGVRNRRNLNAVHSGDMIQEASRVAVAPMLVLEVPAAMEPTLERRMISAEINFDNRKCARRLQDHIPCKERASDQSVGQPA